MDKLKYIAGHNGRSANKEIEQLILAHIASYESVHDPIVLTEEDTILSANAQIDKAGLL